jgi:hypothetical protein
MKACLLAAVLVIAVVVSVAHSQTTTLAPTTAPAANSTGLLLHDPAASPGYTLLAPIPSKMTYLIDLDGRIVHEWKSDYRPALAAYLLPNGHLLRTAMEGRGEMRAFLTGGAGGRVQEFDWDGNLLWDYRHLSDDYQLHHDIKPLPNGNVLMIAWEKKSAGAAIASGRDPNLLADGELWVDKIIEVKPTGKTGGEIVWEWHVWNHLIQHQHHTKPAYGTVADHLELVDLNFAPQHGPPGTGDADWTHFNSIDYNPRLDQVLVSVHSFGEIWIIDHSTTSKEAAGHTGGHSGRGGDLMYRWGNPRAYGASGPQKFFGQHSAAWIDPGLVDAGRIMVFNNGERRPEGPFSTVEILVPPILSDGNYEMHGAGFDPERPVWIYTAPNPTDFFSRNISGAQRLPNGNTLICSGADGTLFEIDPHNKTVWKFAVPAERLGPGFDGPPSGPFGGPPGRPMRPPGLEGHSPVFRAIRYPTDYPGLRGKDLTPGQILRAGDTATRGVPQP